MGNTPHWNIPYPEGSKANDIHADIEALALSLDDVAKDSQGSFANRPAAKQGRWYNCTDTDTDGGLFRSDGTNWIRVTPSPWATWFPTIRVTDGAGQVSTSVTATVSSYVFQYRILPGNRVEFIVEAQVALHGSYVYCGLCFTSPIASGRAWELSAEAMNDLARARIEDSGAPLGGNNIAIFPHSGYAANDWQFNPTTVYVGRWYVDNSNRLVRINGIYPI